MHGAQQGAHVSLFAVISCPGLNTQQAAHRDEKSGIAGQQRGTSYVTTTTHIQSFLEFHLGFIQFCFLFRFRRVTLSE
jgi:hypothetical protein